MFSPGKSMLNLNFIKMNNTKQKKMCRVSARRLSIDNFLWSLMKVQRKIKNKNLNKQEKNINNHQFLHESIEKTTILHNKIFNSNIFHCSKSFQSNN
jgi:hypothetical protein